MKRSLALAAVTVLSLSVGLWQWSSAQDLGRILRGGVKAVGIGYLVRQNARALDRFINDITIRQNVPINQATKVVPILSVGDKGYIGAAQVMGPKQAVDKVQAVFQIEESLDRFRIKVLVPSDSLTGLRRVEKVGISALIDVALEGGFKVTHPKGLGGKEVIAAAAVAVAVKNAGNQLNEVINRLSLRKDAAEFTKVIPMATLGENAYIGGAQVSGAAADVDKVQGVWQYEDLFSNGMFRVKILIPTDDLNPLKLRRVDGVGLTAVIDMRVMS
ncbi:MAG: hypothetical protein RMK92_01945 [Armatimonadota bacterium]|nr:hypothetical protein [Armatimonadota bacterium]MDW8103748.1 hypothetical protein [Armatimonadota bacterium]